MGSDLGLPDGQRKIRYDAAGNLRNDIHTGSGERTYDAENRMTTATDGGTAWTSRYTYDAGGRRVRRAVKNQPEVWQVYGIDGELLAEYAAGNASFVQTKEYGYRSGQLLVTASNGDESRLTRFVNNIFYGAWGRSPSTQERQQKVNQLASSGAQGQAQLLADAKQTLSDMFNDAQYTQRSRTNRQYAGDLYWSYFGRGAQASELDYWEGRLNLPTNDPQYITREGLRQVCEAWSEFTTLVSALWGTAYDNQRVDHWLWNVYIGSVGSAPSTGQMQPHIVALNEAGAQGQAALLAKAHEIARQKMESAEYAARNRTDEEFVADLHQVFWQRTPDASSLSHWTNQVGLRGREYVLDRFALSSAFQEVAGTLYKEVMWLIADHLGTPRMIAERTGTLSGIKRHDYLPFGEEIEAGLGGRTAEQGYATDSVRQQFTGQERDDETGLDYFHARYHSSTQGRFTSVDPLMASAHVASPQSWNRYSYTLNNPLRYVDPTGMRATSPIELGTEEDERRLLHELSKGMEQQQNTNPYTKTANNSADAAVDASLTRLFTDGTNGMVIGADAYRNQSNKAGVDSHFQLADGTTLHTIHVIGDAAGNKIVGVYAPKEFSEIKYEGGKDSIVTATNPKTGEVLGFAHVNVSSQAALDKNMKKTNGEGSRLLGDIGGPNGNTAGNKHTHVTYFKNAEARADAKADKPATETRMGDFGSKHAQYLGNFRKLVK